MLIYLELQLIGQTRISFINHFWRFFLFIDLVSIQYDRTDLPWISLKYFVKPIMIHWDVLLVLLVLSGTVLKLKAIGLLLHNNSICLFLIFDSIVVTVIAELLLLLFGERAILLIWWSAIVYLFFFVLVINFLNFLWIFLTFFSLFWVLRSLVDLWDLGVLLVFLLHFNRKWRLLIFFLNLRLFCFFQTLGILVTRHKLQEVLHFLSVTHIQNVLVTSVLILCFIMHRDVIRRGLV